MPTRIQRRRTKGFRLPPGVICVTRPSVFGNPFRWQGAREAGYRGTEDQLRAFAVQVFREWLTDNRRHGHGRDAELAELLKLDAGASRQGSRLLVSARSPLSRRCPFGDCEPMKKSKPAKIAVSGPQRAALCDAITEPFKGPLAVHPFDRDGAFIVRQINRDIWVAVEKLLKQDRAAKGKKSR